MKGLASFGPLPDEQYGETLPEPCSQHKASCLELERSGGSTCTSHLLLFKVLEAGPLTEINSSPPENPLNSIARILL